MDTKVKQAVETAQDKIDAGVDTAQQAVRNTADAVALSAHRAEASIQDGLSQVRAAIPAHLSRAAHRAEDMARAGIDKARSAGHQVAARAQQVGASTTAYVREKPTQALLLAAAAGAAAAVLVGWATRRRADGSYRF